ncbi:acyl-CoA dehydrogenase family protein [Schlesneria paludicola]|uniref:acyl-CoA dehydrogenase family protein n=1 Tax=Schlesneria paludicola TaxID=360056 RepID=UPI00029A3FA9|nr:acyl-CoA dehydrogenase family protein [Schlesneria paludicola]
MTSSNTILAANVSDLLLAHAEQADRSINWPAESWNALGQAGMLGRSIPAEFGGTAVEPVAFQLGMEEISSSCLTTAFILSQREAAVRQLLKGPAHLQQRYLPSLVDGSAYVTVGLSQLTTSRQHLGPVLRATPTSNGGYCLDGEIPWVTGADHAIGIVAGATLPDGQQLLVVIPADRLRGMIETPLPLAALVGSRTSLIRCRQVELEADCVLMNPTDNVLGKLGGGGLDTSCLAIGLTGAVVRYLQHEAERRPDLLPIAERFESAWRSAQGRLHQLAQSVADSGQTLELRLDCTKLALRSAQAGLMIAKGVGFVSPHPVQRWVRQAMFFLVWSCPRPVAEGVLADLADF